ncbi:sigma-54-dependent transcriptional regulator [Thermosulfuriphilus sp.]
MAERILVVDDEESIIESLSGILEDEGFEVEGAISGQEALNKVSESVPDLVLLDVWLPDLDGLDVLRELKVGYPDLPVIIISGHGTVETAVRATKLGAHDFIEKPLSYDRVVLSVRNALKFRALERENVLLKNKVRTRQITGTSPAVLRLREQIARVAPTDSTVLILGESGAGKEVVAQMIHAASRRREKPLVEINCAAIPEDLIEAELFGYEKGAFTGALTSKKGKFDLADGGTLFLDEIGDMSLKTQAKILRILQEQRFERVGGTRTLKVDVRIIAATNKDLRQEIKRGNFREDLYYRLNVVPIEVPPLRERLEDIPLLIEDFLQEIAENTGLGRKRVTPEVLEALERYHWPGNVRELRNLVERLVIMSPGPEIEISTLPDYIRNPDPPSKGLQEPWFACEDLRQARALFEREFILRKLRAHGGNISQTAEAIGLERSHLYRKMRSLGILGIKGEET